jgi:hypothetical protein
MELQKLVEYCMFIYCGVDVGKRLGSDVSIILRKALKLRIVGYFWINSRIVTVKIKTVRSHLYIANLCASARGELIETEGFCIRLQEIVINASKMIIVVTVRDIN